MSGNYNDDKYDLRDLLAGFVMLFIGGFMLLKNMTVYSFGFSRWFGDATGGVMIMIFVACFMVMIIYTNFFTKLLTVLSFVSIIINVVMGTRIVFHQISAIALIFMCMMFFGGLAFMLKVLLVPRSVKRRKRQDKDVEAGDTVDNVERELEELKKRTK